MTEQSKITYELRKGFIEKLKVTKSNAGAIMRGALLAAVVGVFCDFDVDADYFAELLGVTDTKRDYETIVLDAIDNLDKSNSVKNIPRIIWELFGDCENKVFGANYWHGEWPEYEPDPSLIALYKWLVELGYPISEVELGLIQGSDVNYHLGDTEKEAAE